MTECERLILNGTFTRDFFKPEVRCDFLVDEKRKKIWAIEIDLLLQFDKVCKKHGLRYWLAGGTLLGAIRHQGFIPWDDDIDVFMPRADYEKLMGLASEFEEPYFLQTPFTDPGYFFGFLKLRNTNSTYISPMFVYQGIHQGIPIDIFAFDDHIPSNDGEKRFDEIMSALLANSTYMRMSNPHLDEKDQRRVAAYPGGDPMQRYLDSQAACQADNGKGSAWVWTPTGAPYGYKHCVYRKSDCTETVSMPFSGFDFPVPKGFDGVLKCEYGDYMQLPPKEKRGVWHSNSIVEPDLPYAQVLKEKFGVTVSDLK